MRAVLALAALLLLVPLAFAGGATTAPHSANTLSVTHEPEQPSRGMSVDLRVGLADDTLVESVRAIYCRAQNYACAPALNMTPVGNATYADTIPWNSRFFNNVRDVGYKFEIHYRNGTKESTPVTDYPYTPTGLPADADRYYFYRLEAASPAPPLMVLVLVFALLAVRRNTG